ncbi:MAG: alpha/beta fold hydrolase [Myxococcota bacterium]
MDVEAPRARVRVLEIGEGPPVLCVHGSPNAAAAWIPLAAAMPGWRWLLLERPGAGVSGTAAWGPSHRTDALAISRRTLDALDAPRARVVGSSFGALYAFALALGAPERVERLVIAGCPAGPTFVAMPPIFRALSVPWLPTLLGSFVPTDPASIRGMWRDIGHGATIDRGGIPDEMFDWYGTLLKETDTMAGVVAEVRAVATPFGYRAGVPVTEEDLARIVAPTLYLWGDLDNFGSPDQGERMAAATPGARIERFPTFGHLPWIDDPALVAQRLSAFFG